MQYSFWELDQYFRDVDFTIVGSGLVGLNAALRLRELHPKAKILVLERGVLPSGASSKNAGFCCFGSPSELLSDLKVIGEDNLFSLVERRWKGLSRLRSILGDNLIDFRMQGGHELFTNSDQELYENCHDQLDYLNHHLKDIIGRDTFQAADHLIPEFGFQGVTHLIKCQYEGQIDTGLMINALVDKARREGIIVLNNITVKSLEESVNGVLVHTDRTPTIACQQVIVATNGFGRHLLPELDVKPARAQVLITKPIDGLKIRGTFHYDQGYYYFRDIGDRLLFGGGRNLDPAGETADELETTTMIQEALDKLLTEVILPQTPFEIEHRWAGIMGVGETKSPIIKKLSPHVYCALRLGGMGVALGSLVGAEVAEMVSAQ